MFRAFGVSAAAWLFCSVATTAEESSRAPIFMATEFEAHVRFLASDELAGRLPGSPGAAKAAEYIIRHFETAGLEPLQSDGDWFQVFPLPAGVEGHSILGVFPGRGSLQDEAVLVTGHYDHIGVATAERERDGDRIFNGADDNAAGVSMLLMVARQLAGTRSNLGDNYRTVLFTSFDAEEKGLLGARHYVRNPLWPLNKTAVVINFDGGGRLRMGKVYASDAETNPLLSATVKSAASAQGLIAETRFGGHGRSDHAVFAERGIPGVHFVTGAHNDYHQVTDEADRVNFEGGAKIAAIGYATLRRMMSHPDGIRFHRLKPEFDVNFGINLARIVGVVPMLNAQEGRYPQILYVIPGSPAANLGLQSGDQVTALDGMKFQRVEDFISIFPRLDLSDGVRISLLRSGKVAEVRIPAAVIAEFSGPTSMARPDGRFDVAFHYTPTSKDVGVVYLAGEFNEWNPVGHAMDGPDRDGRFKTRLTLPRGFHEYKFVEEGKEWKTDPLNMHSTGFYKNSVVWVGAQRAPEVR